MIRVSAIGAVSVVLAACSALPTERQLIGTWRMPVDQFEDQFGITHRKPTMAENTLKPDHTYTSSHLGHHGMITGHWRLSGRWLSYEFPSRRYRRSVVERYRAKILKLSDRELIVSDTEGRDGEWTKVR